MRVSERPRLRSVRTQSWRMVSSTDPRTWTAMTAMAPTDRAMIGSVTVSSQPVTDVENGTYPVGRNQASPRAKTFTRRIAMRKPGMANPSTDTTCTVRSAQPRRRAAHTPSTVATTAVSAVVPITSESVTPMREVIAAITDCWVNHDVPKSPVTAAPSQAA